MISFKKTLQVFEKKFNKVSNELKKLKEYQINLRMENQQLIDLNEMLENRKNNIFYTSHDSFDDPVTVRISEFNEPEEVKTQFVRSRKCRKYFIIAFVVFSVLFLFFSYPVFGAIIGY